MVKSLSTSLILRGILAVVVGVVALAWPGVTVLALVILFAVCAFMAAGAEAVRAFRSQTAGPVIGHLLLGLVNIGAGVIALAWPGPTALVLVLLVGAWAAVSGLLEIYAGFRAGEPAGTRALFFVSGLVSIAFGIVLFARPGIGAVTLALLFGLFNLIYGISTLMLGIDLRRTRNHLASQFAERPGIATNAALPSHTDVGSVV
jgi:uncharacterized membrane protein HdeD (DUF308 family)